MPRKIAKKRNTPKKKYFGTQPVKSLEEIERLAEHAIASGPATPLTREDFEKIRRKLRSKYGNPNGRAR